ncbi:hypothetical protein A3729_27860 [Oleiphilus sp. HI0043]|nr:hypothetical protein A3729_27860 [Oleiphilus sp. HI0043]
MSEVQVHVSSEGYQSNCDLSFQGMEFSNAAHGEQQYEALIHYANKQQVSDRLPLMVSEVLLSNHSSQFSVASSDSAKTLEVLRWFAKADKALHRAIQKQSSR